MFEVILPVPPTDNNLFANNRRTGGRYPSPSYNAWREAAWVKFKQQHRSVKTFQGRLSISFIYHFPDKRRRDIANFQKSICDFLVERRVMGDDSQIDEMILKRGSPGNGVFIAVREIA